MRKFIKNICLASIIFLSSTSRLSADQSGEQRSIAQQSVVKSLAAMFVVKAGDNPKVDYIEIFRNPPSASFDGRILESPYTLASASPALLEELSVYKLKVSFLNRSTIKDLLGIFDCFGHALTKLEIKNANDPHPKLTWGVVFYRQDNTRIASIYMDEEGQNGYLDSATVGFSSERAFTGCLKNDVALLWQDNKPRSWWSDLFNR